MPAPTPRVERLAWMVQADPLSGLQPPIFLCQPWLFSVLRDPNLLLGHARWVVPEFHHPLQLPWSHHSPSSTKFGPGRVFDCLGALDPLAVFDSGSAPGPPFFCVRAESVARRNNGPATFWRTKDTGKVPVKCLGEMGFVDWSRQRSGLCIGSRALILRLSSLLAS